MRLLTLILPAALLALGACGAPAPATNEQGFLTELSPAVAALAAPGQNLDTVQWRPEDGCYWYLYEGPVETLMVPLRGVDGGKICAPGAIG